MEEKKLLENILEEVKFIHKTVDIIESIVLGDLITEPVQTDFPFPDNLIPDPNGYSYIDKEEK